MLRHFIALLAVIGLLISPAAATAAQAKCVDGRTEMSMPMADMPGMHQVGAAKADPCCDPANDHGGKSHDGDCLQTCIAMCGVVAALPAGSAMRLVAAQYRPPTPATATSSKPHDPSRLERPPRLIA